MPNKRVIDFYYAAFSDFFAAFLYVKDPLKEDALVQSGELDPSKLSLIPSSREWLINCLRSLPINIYTNDEKERIVQECWNRRESRVFANKF